MISTRIKGPLLSAMVLGLLAACGGAQSRFEAHLNRGKSYLAAASYDKAGVEFRNALQIRPKSAEALYLQGQVTEHKGDARQAAGLYLGAIDVDASYVPARAGLGKLYVFGGAGQKALDTVAPALAAHPDNPDLLAVRAAARHQLNKDDPTALGDAEQAVRLAPANENAVAVRAALFVEKKDYVDAVALLRDAVTLKPTSVDLREVLTNLYLLNSQTREAEQQMQQIIELRPTELAPRFQLAAHLRRAHELDAAQKVLEDAVQTSKTWHDEEKTDKAELALVDFIVAERSREQGEHRLREFIAQRPNNYELRFGLGALLQRAGATPEAIATYEEVVKRDQLGAHGLAARDRLALIEYQQGHTAKARTLVGEVLQKNPRDDDALILRADLELQENDATGAIADLRAVLRNQPQSAVLQRSLAKAYLQKGEPALAEETLRGLIKMAPADSAARIALAEQLARSSRVDQAIALLQEGINKSSQSVPVRVALIRTLLARPDAEAARAAAMELESIQPQSPLGPYFAGLAALQQHKLDDSTHELEHALTLQADDLEILQALVRVDAAAGKPERSLVRARAALQHNPTNPPLINFVGELLVQAKQYAAASGQFTQAQAAAPKWWVPRRNLAFLHRLQNEAQPALDEYQAALKLAPLEFALVSEATAYMEAQGRIDDAIAAYRALYQGNQQAKQLAANNLAMLLATYKADQASLDQARDLTAVFASSDNGSLLDTSGWVRFKRGEFRDALPLLERATTRAPDSRVIRYHLAMTELRLGLKDRARTNLQSALAGQVNFTGSDEARTTLASLESHSG